MMAQGGFLVHQVLILQPTFGFVLAATVVSVTTIMGTVGRVAFAAVGDRWAPRQIAAAMFVLQAVGLGSRRSAAAPDRAVMPRTWARRPGCSPPARSSSA